MQDMLPLTVGPIVGYTTSTSVRIFGRGDYQPAQQGYKRCHGVARIKKSGDAVFPEAVVFKMNPNFDFTGIIEFLELLPEQAYEYEMAYLFDEAEPDMINAANLDWNEASKGSFTTAKADQAKPISFVFGSCRYLLKLGPFNFFDDRGDKVFRSIYNQIKDDKVATDLLLMVGDQIYADDLNFVGADSTLGAYNQRYRDSFTQENIRKLMSNLPTYMILDDHEIEDNWPAKANSRDYQDKYPSAMHAYQTYQMSHSPVLTTVSGKFVDTPDSYWYSFMNGAANFFVMDTRTERFVSKKEGSLKQMVNQSQLKALKEWLKTCGNDQVKFIVSGVPFFPDFTDDVSDKWGGYPAQRAEILDYIKENKITRVVFLAGDVHCSLSSQLTCEDDPSFKVTSIISSSFFWPYPQGKQKDFQLKGHLNPIGSNKYELQNSSEVVSDDNFTRVTLGDGFLDIGVFGRKGDVVAKGYRISI